MDARVETANVTENFHHRKGVGDMENGYGKLFMNGSSTYVVDSSTGGIAVYDSKIEKVSKRIEKRTREESEGKGQTK